MIGRSMLVTAIQYNYIQKPSEFVDHLIYLGQLCVCIHAHDNSCVYMQETNSLSA
jgi:hypothetical protein